MKANSNADFERFASSFVRGYWSTIKDGTFSMPPDEPVEETLEELLSAVSFEIEPISQGHHKFRMTGDAGDWWTFGFNRQRETWKITSASARSDKKNSPHDLFDEARAPHFRPFLEHVAVEANKHSEQDVTPNA